MSFCNLKDVITSIIRVTLQEDLRWETLPPSFSCITIYWDFMLDSDDNINGCNKVTFIKKISIQTHSSSLPPPLGFVLFQVNRGLLLIFTGGKSQTLSLCITLVNCFSIKPNILGVCMSLLLKCVVCLSFWSVCYVFV